MMKKPLAAMLLACHLLVAAMSVSPALHHWLHGHDTDGPDHTCLVTALASGLLDAPAAPPVGASAPVLAAGSLVVVVPARPMSARFVGVLGGRAPPVA
jgi:hypothetical protein